MPFDFVATKGTFANDLSISRLDPVPKFNRHRNGMSEFVRIATS